MLPDLLVGVAIGFVGGVASGLTGTSPGGALVVLSSALLGADQRAAQGVALLAQVPPTSLSGIARYRAGGACAPWRWILWLTVGFVAGGLGGAFAVGGVSDRALRWTYVVYLVLLGALAGLRRPGGGLGRVSASPDEASAAALLAIGTVAGISAGFLGIGGGLAITVGLTVLLGVSQHEAQMVSLILALAPVNLPAAWVYYQQGWIASWPALAGVVVGLVAGGDIGARFANRLSAAQLRGVMLAVIAGMAAFMAWKATT